MNEKLFNYLITEVLVHPYWTGLFFMGLASGTVRVVMPTLIYVSKLKKLNAPVNNRSSHRGFVPSMGGVAIFIGYFVSVNLAVMLLANRQQFIMLVVFNICLFLFLVMGMIDDIIGVRAWVKLRLQIVLALAFVFLTDIRIPSFNGVLGIETLPVWASILFSAFVMVVLINAVNLIDGIDGLAASQVLLVSAILAGVFFQSGFVMGGLSSSIIVGTLTVFLYYNFSTKRKIFLGDAGSILLGFLLAFEIILIFRVAAQTPLPIAGQTPRLFALALCGYPLLDMARVFVLRLSQGQSPFRADKQHLHHLFLRHGLSHKASTLLIFGYSLLLVLVAYVLRDLPIYWDLAVFISAGTILMALLQLLAKHGPLGCWFKRFR